MVVVISDEYLDSDACDFQVKFALSLSPGRFHFCYVQQHSVNFSDTCLFMTLPLFFLLFQELEING